MDFLIAGLAVYKMVHVLDIMSPRNAMPWVKVVVTVLVSYGAVALLSIPNVWTSGLAVATIASACHAVMRLITLWGDYLYRKPIK